MGLKVTITSGTGTSKKTAELVDSPDPLPSYNFTLNGQRVLQVVDLFRASSIRVYGRGNRRVSISFEVTRHHDSILDAVEFIIDHEADVPEEGTAVFDFTDDDGGSMSRWMEYCGVESVQCVQHIGTTTRWAYSLIGSTLLKSNPNQA